MSQMLKELDIISYCKMHHNHRSLPLNLVGYHSPMFLEMIALPNGTYYTSVDNGYKAPYHNGSLCWKSRG